MATRTSDLLQSVQVAHKFDEGALLRYARLHVPGFPPAPANLTVSQFGHGQSNPTYLLEVSSHISTKYYVLRKRPSGRLLESAHAVEREFQGISPASRRSIFSEIAKTLASLHGIDVTAIGLDTYGRQLNYCMRQVERWAKQYLASTGDGKPERNPKMIDLIDWLRQHIPDEDSKASASGLVHGDFRIDNLVFHPVEDRVIGILDWELSTLGNQMCDVATSCLHYVIDIKLEDAIKGFEHGHVPEGIPSLAEYLREYCIESGKPWPAEAWKFYVAFSLFRAASIFAGIFHRWIMGNASGGKRAQHAGKVGNILIDAAWAYINQPSVLPTQPPVAIGCGPPTPDSLFKEVEKRSHNFKGETRGFVPSERIKALRDRLIKFMETYIYPMESEFQRQAQSNDRWRIHPEEERLKELAKSIGLWNLWIPVDSAEKARALLSDVKSPDSSSLLLGAGLSNLEYGYLCEIMGRSMWAPQIFNCGAPDTGNMEVLLRYGNLEQQRQWLVPLLNGKIRSAFAMTEPGVASSDATNIECSITRQGDHYIINGRKWWTSGAMDPRCSIFIVMGKTNITAPLHEQQSMILVDVKAPGVCIKRPLTVFGFDDAPHGHAEVTFENVRVPVSNILLGEGRGFEIAQGRLGPGRLHHCMRLIGAAERGMQIMVERALSRKVFGKLIAEQGSFLSDLAKCRTELEMTRLLVLEAANQLDLHGNKKARGFLAMAKVAAPRTALQVLDMAIQVHGGAGVSSDTVLAHLWASARTLRIADGPDEVHLGTIAKLEVQKAKL
ncbi:unnamed protein product [Victoria cruziana]